MRRLKGLAAADDPGAKVCVEGTHRVRDPAETWQLIQPVFDKVGITRVADVTWLDDLGIPVYQAIRPDSWTLSVAQGKGLTPELARVSAAMESIELWHAERVGPGDRITPLGEMVARLGYPADELPLAGRHALNPASRLEWTAATRLTDGTTTWLPTGLLRLDGRLGSRWSVPLFMPTTNGLASGNTRMEAALHGLYEIAERDARARTDGTDRHRVLDLTTVDGPAGELVERLRRAGVQVQVAQLPSDTGLPCFEARLYGDTVPLTFYGCGCHRDRDVALCRALTEAAQSRLTMIAGTRDDMSPSRYVYARTNLSAGSHAAELVEFAPGGRIAFGDVPTTWAPDLTADLRDVVARLAKATGRDPMLVDHTRPELGVPVVHVVCPGLRMNL